jgi:hypothetical protein
MCRHLLEPIDYVVVAYFLRNWARLESAALRYFIAKCATVFICALALPTGSRDAPEGECRVSYACGHS